MAFTPHKVFSISFYDDKQTICEVKFVFKKSLHRACGND